MIGAKKYENKIKFVEFMYRIPWILFCWTR